MTEDVYRELARRLDAVPNGPGIPRLPAVGFPATESGVELHLLAKIFTPEEATLAAAMNVVAEPAADIAARVGLEARAAYSALKGMVRKGLIEARKGRGGLVFGLIPWAVGVYENQLPRMDAELAAVFEAYYQETRGASLRGEVPVHRVIPVREAIPFDLEILPYEGASEMVERAKSWGVRDCICRIQQRLIGKGCERPVENCLIFAPVEDAFAHSKVDRPITKEEALSILREAEEAGLVHSTSNTREGHGYICNCCTCCCGILRGVAEFGIPTAIARSDFEAVVDAESCVGCGDCIERCLFGALSVPEDICVVEAARCVGCGLCSLVCPTEALRLTRRPQGEVPLPPADMQEWVALYAQEHGAKQDAES